MAQSRDGIGASADEAMLFFVASQGTTLAERGDELRAAYDKAMRAFIAAPTFGEMARTAAIAANACYQLSFVEARKTRVLAWLFIAARWAAVADTEELYWAHPFASFHARMFGAQALIRAGMLAPWRRTRLGAKVMLLGGFGVAESPYFYAPLFRAALARGIGWSLHSMKGAPPADVTALFEERLHLLEAEMSPDFTAQMPIEAIEIHEQAAIVNLDFFARAPAPMPDFFAVGVRALIAALDIIDRELRVSRARAADLERLEMRIAHRFGSALAWHDRARPADVAKAVRAATGRRQRMIDAMIGAIIVEMDRAGRQQSLPHVLSTIAAMPGGEAVQPYVRRALSNPDGGRRS